MSELAEDLRAYLEHRVVRAYETGALAEMKKWVARNKGMAASIAAAAVVAVGGFALVAKLQSVRAEEALLAKKEISEANTRLERTNVDLKEARDDAKANEAKAVANESKATAALSDVLRLSDVKRLADYREEAEALWPALPEKVAAMEAWLAKAGKLVERLPRHRETLEELRAKALPYEEAERTRDRERHPQAGALAALVAERAKLEAAASGPASAPAAAASAPIARLEEIAREIAALEAKVAVRRTWRFGETEAQWQHDTLSGLVAGIEELADRDPAVGAIAEVEERLAFAKTVKERSIEAHQAEWDAVIAGLRITPQLGLVPIGRDPASGLWEFAHLATGEAPVRGADGGLVLTEKTGLVFVLIPGSSFEMGAQRPTAQTPAGSPNVDPQAEDNESPVHTVVLAPYFLSKYEMTQGQWLAATRRRPSQYGPGTRFGDKATTLRHPVEQVSWEECDRVLGRLGLVLPTEAQWEYGARAGSRTPWWTGEAKESIGGAGNLADRFCQSNGGPSGWVYEEWLDDGFTVHAPVGSYRPNAFGLHDTIGNVWEWCRDEYAGYARPVRRGDGLRSSAGARSRVFRGGGFSLPASIARSANRYNATPELRYDNLGVRPARVITE
jgi:formylglycine-generating enzyme required for sulfatase activity